MNQEYKNEGIKMIRKINDQIEKHNDVRILRERRMNVCLPQSSRRLTPNGMKQKIPPMR